MSADRSDRSEWLELADGLSPAIKRSDVLWQAELHQFDENVPHRPSSFRRAYAADVLYTEAANVCSKERTLKRQGIE